MRCFLLLCLFTSFFLEAADCRDYFTRGMKSWKFWAPPGCVVKFRHSKEEGATKKGALEIVVGAGNPMGKTAVFTNHYPVVSGRSYCVKVAVKEVGLKTGSMIVMSVQGKDAKERFLGTGSLKKEWSGSERSDGSWRMLEYRFSVPCAGKWKDTLLIIFCMGVRDCDSGRVFFDDFEFTEEGMK